MDTAVIVGAGGMGRAWGNLIAKHADVELGAWVDILPDAAAKAAASLELDPLVTDDLGKAIAEVEPAFVVDCSVPNAHRPVTIQSLEAGVPVIGEKPMAETIEDARAMVEASDRNGVLYMVSQSRRYNPHLTALRDALAHIGRPEILNADFYANIHIGGFRDEMPSPLIQDMAIHTFDEARYLLGDIDPVAVYCEDYATSWSRWKHEATAVAIFEMAGGLRFTYRGSWDNVGRNTSWESEWRAVGPNGAVTWDGGGVPLCEVVDPAAAQSPNYVASKPVEVTVPDTGPSSIGGSLEDMRRYIHSGAKPMGECHDNIKSLAMVLAAVESGKRGERIPVVW